MIQKRVIYYLLLIGLTGLSACSNDDAINIDSPAAGAIMDPLVGGSNQPNQVFIDLSEMKQTTLARNSWDLGFSTGNDFRVVLNNSTSTLARPINKNDLNSVTAQDTINFGAQLNMDAIFGALFGPPTTWLASAASWTDDPSGALDKTAIAPVSENAEDNLVYIVNRGKNPDSSPRGWMKIRVLRNGDGYLLQYAEINATTFSELSIPKNDAVDVVPVSFDNGVISDKPGKNDWDFMFTIFTDLLQIDATTSIPYAIKDYILINAGKVEAARVEITQDVTYEGFTIGAIGSLSFSNQLKAIGSDWRNVAQPNSDIQTGVRENVFYIIKDTADNFYKLRFTRLVDAQTGERGHPQIQFELLVQ